MAVEIYRPELWHDFFLMVGGAAAALTGLVFVAMSLSLDAILEDELPRHRAIATLTGFATAFVVAAFLLIPGQPSSVVGVEWLIAALISAAVYEFGHIHTLSRSGGAVVTLRWIVGIVLHGAHVLGAALLALGNVAGLYLAAPMLILLMGYQISAAWLLLATVHKHPARAS